MHKLLYNLHEYNTQTSEWDILVASNTSEKELLHDYKRLSSQVLSFYIHLKTGKVVHLTSKDIEVSRYYFIFWNWESACWDNTDILYVTNDISMSQTLSKFYGGSWAALADVPNIYVRNNYGFRELVKVQKYDS